MSESTTDEVIATVTLTRALPNRREFRATAQLHKLGGNRRPHFSVTAEELNLRRKPENQVEACGQLTDETLKHFPQLAPLVALHLSDDTGEPMHAVDNGAYWLGLGDPRYVPEDAPRMDLFAQLWRVTDEQARELYDYANADPNPREALRFLAKGEAARWQREANEGLALIRQLSASR